MSDKKEPFDELFEGVKQIRDELKVKIHLGKAEAKKEWEKLENKLEELKARKPASPAGNASFRQVTTQSPPRGSWISRTCWLANPNSWPMSHTVTMFLPRPTVQSRKSTAC